MQKYFYKLLNPSLLIEKGALYAVSPKEAALKLSPNYILSINKPFGFPKINKSSSALWPSFFLNFSNLINNGIPISSALNCMRKEEKDNNYKNVLFNLENSISKGNFLSEALSIYIQDIPYGHHIISLIKQAEGSGNLKDILNDINAYIEEKQEFKNELIKALIHPMVLFIASLLFLLLVNFFIIPQFEIAFNQFDYSMPKLIKAFLLINKFLVFVGLAMIFVSLTLYKTPKYNALFKKALSYVPYINRFSQKIFIANLFKNISFLLNKGHTLIDCLSITYKSLPEGNNKSKIKLIYKSIKNGEYFSNAVKCFEFIPNSIIQSIYIGEQSASLPKVLLYISKTLEKDIRKSLNYAIKLIEPVIIILIGLWLGITILIIFSPLFQCIQKLSLI